MFKDTFEGTTQYCKKCELEAKPKDPFYSRSAVFFETEHTCGKDIKTPLKKLGVEGIKKIYGENSLYALSLLESLEKDVEGMKYSRRYAMNNTLDRVLSLIKQYKEQLK